jgi:hypothetical protein
MKTGEALAVDSINQILSRSHVCRITIKILSREGGDLLSDFVLLYSFIRN